jgi:hypothetical protein
MSDPTVAGPDSPDGKSYVDAVTAAGQRSRTLIYFILILTVLTFATVRNSYEPDWVGQRYQTREQMYACYFRNECPDALDKRLVKAGLMPEHPSDVQRRTALKGAAKILDIDLESLRPAKRDANPSPPAESSAPADVDNWNRREFTLMIEAMIKREADNDTITLPLLGSSIDINDLWIVSGGMMFFLLYFLRTSQKQEERNIRYIQARTNEFDDLVAMNQVLSPHSLDVGLLGKILEWGFGLLPSFLYLYLAYEDWSTIDVSTLYVGRTETFWEYAIELLLVGVVIYNNVRCLMNQQNIRNLIRPAYARLSGPVGVVAKKN